MKTEGVAIRKLFPALEFGLPTLLVVTCLVPSKVPGYVSYGALRVLRADPRRPVFLEGEGGRPPAAYAVPGDPDRRLRGDDRAGRLDDGGPAPALQRVFIPLALLDIAVSKLSKRKEGFKSTPLDFLIVLLAVLVPNLPEQSLQGYNLGLVAAKIIILYFSYEVVIAEMRMRYDRVMVGTLGALAVVFLKGVA